MKPTASFKKITVNIICCLYILLFVYAAFSKIIDFESFQIQLGKSPIIDAFAIPLSFLVPLIEIGIALLLISTQYRFIALLCSLGLMTAFSIYIIIILNWSYYVPCSCGGILEKLGWTEHLVFNMAFIVIALVGLLFIKSETAIGIQKSLQGYNIVTPTRFVLILFLTMLLSSALVFGLYITSDRGSHRNNAFQRHFPPQSPGLVNAIELKYNSFYIAGISDGSIFLGNTTAPLYALAVDTLLKNVTPLDFSLIEHTKNRQFNSLQFRVLDSVYFLSDRSIPAIFKGTIGNWTATEIPGKFPSFSSIEPISRNALGLVVNDRVTKEDEIAVMMIDGVPNLKINPELLVKQVDGVFDTDGILLYNQELNKIIYVYYYRNQYVITDDSAKFISKGVTIDTVTTATVKVTKNKSKNETTVAGVPVIINADAATYGNFLFIKSNRLGKSEPDRVLKQASIVDIYNLSRKRYAFSFYLYDYNNEKVRSFAVYGNLLVVLTNNHLVTYRLDSRLF